MNPSLRRTCQTYIVGIISCVAILLAKKFFSEPQYTLWSVIIALSTVALIAIPDIVGLFTTNDWILYASGWGKVHKEVFQKKKKYSGEIIELLRSCAVIFYFPLYCFTVGKADFGLREGVLLVCAILIFASFRIASYCQGIYSFVRNFPNMHHLHQQGISESFLHLPDGKAIYSKGVYIAMLFIFALQIYLILDDTMDIEAICYYIVNIIVVCILFFYTYQSRVIWTTLKKYIMAPMADNKTDGELFYDNMEQHMLYFERNISVLTCIILYSCFIIAFIKFF